MADLALVMGVGGMGIKIVADLRRRLEASLTGRQALANSVQILAVDAGDTAERALVPPGDFCDIGQDLVADSYVASRKDDRDFRQWWYFYKDDQGQTVPYMPGIVFNPGLGQVRMHGPLALDHALKHQLVSGRIAARIGSLTALQAAGTGTNIRCLLVGSVGGGTGAGTMLLLAAYLRHRLAAHPHSIALVVIDPTVIVDCLAPILGHDSVERIAANGIAAPSEFEYWRFHKSSRFQMNLGGLAIDTRCPVDHCFVVQYKNEQGKNAKTLGEYVDLTAGCLHHLLGSVISTTVQSWWINIATSQQVASLHRDKQSCAYASFGCASLVYPVDKVKRFCAMTLARDGLQALQKPPVTGSALSDQVTAYLANLGLSRQKLREAFSKDLGRLAVLRKTPERLIEEVGRENWETERSTTENGTRDLLERTSAAVPTLRSRLLEAALTGQGCIGDQIGQFVAGGDLTRALNWIAELERQVCAGREDVAKERAEAQTSKAQSDRLRAAGDAVLEQLCSAWTYVPPGFNRRTTERALRVYAAELAGWHARELTNRWTEPADAILGQVEAYAKTWRRTLCDVQARVLDPVSDSIERELKRLLPKRDDPSRFDASLFRMEIGAAEELVLDRIYKPSLAPDPAATAAALDSWVRAIARAANGLSALVKLAFEGNSRDQATGADTLDARMNHLATQLKDCCTCESERVVGDFVDKVNLDQAIEFEFDGLVGGLACPMRAHLKSQEDLARALRLSTLFGSGFGNKILDAPDRLTALKLSYEGWLNLMAERGAPFWHPAPNRPPLVDVYHLELTAQNPLLCDAWTSSKFSAAPDNKRKSVSQGWAVWSAQEAILWTSRAGAPLDCLDDLKFFRESYRRYRQSCPTIHTDARYFGQWACGIWLPSKEREDLVKVWFARAVWFGLIRAPGQFDGSYVLTARLRETMEGEVLGNNREKAQDFFLPDERQDDFSLLQNLCAARQQAEIEKLPWRELDYCDVMQGMYDSLGDEKVKSFGHEAFYDDLRSHMEADITAFQQEFSGKLQRLREQKKQALAPSEAPSPAGPAPATVAP
ncbi:MAG: hypothetical protein HY814_03795 [Candidatus Riflebacteria bacterium]|nr:hypothetical protein [Candidatus Riflebacteria bacterium]